MAYHRVYAEVHMTKKDVWLKLLTENEVALASAIHLCERYIKYDELIKNKEFIERKREELHNEVPQEDVNSLFGLTR